MGGRNQVLCGFLGGALLVSGLGMTSQPADDRVVQMLHVMDGGLFKPGSEFKRGSKSVEGALEEQLKLLTLIRSSVSGLDVGGAAGLSDMTRRLDDLRRSVDDVQGRTLNDIRSTVQSLERQRDPSGAGQVERKLDDVLRSMRDIERRLSAIERAVR